MTPLLHAAQQQELATAIAGLAPGSIGMCRLRSPLPALYNPALLTRSRGDGGHA